MGKRTQTKKKILVVDDCRHTCEIVCTFFAEQGFEMQRVHNGKEALQAIKKKTFNLIILDVIMPEMGGLDFLKAIKDDAEHNRIPVIMLTAKTTRKDLAEGIALGAEFYLPKPIDMDNLVNFAGLILDSSA